MTMQSAQLGVPRDETGMMGYGVQVDGSSPSALRQQVAERLAAHRQRRGHAVTTGVAEPEQSEGKKHRIAASVAERYAQTPSYRSFLAAEAERASQQAAAAATVAARNAEAVATAERELLAELALWEAPQQFTGEAAPVGLSFPLIQPAAGLTVRLYEALGTAEESSSASMQPAREREDEASGFRWADSDKSQTFDDESQTLDEEIRFRHAPVFEEHIWKHEPATPLPANLLEFPRQLVAARRARPRLAEGPLREESGPRPQLRIFEVEAEQISTSPLTAAHSPEWASLWLDTHTANELIGETDSTLHAATAAAPAPLPASYSLRIMAAAVDATLVLAGLVAFLMVSAKMVGSIPWDFPNGLPAALPMALGLLGTLVVLYAAYHLLFFTFGSQTPGMRYARLGLCTLSDENPSRAAMRRRILAQAVAVAPLGLGVLWALIDGDRLGWHDRISGMYQREY